MKSIKKIKAEIEHTTQIKGIVEVFEELSAIQMKNIREDIIRTREFMEKLAILSNEIGGDLSSFVGDKSSACVYLSSSSGMYGDLPEKVFTSFLKHIESNKTEAFVFGKQGKTFMEKYKPHIKFSYYEIDEKLETKQTMQDCLKMLTYFNEITVFYGKFRNIVNQDAAKQSILGDFQDIFLKLNKKELKEKRFKYIYEPSVVEVSNKFATEIKSSLFEGMLKENNLAKTASRMMHLDKAYESIEERLALLQLTKNRENKKVEDKKQQERVKRLWV